MPAWVGADGYPLSWRHYVYGTAFLMRYKYHNMMDMAQAQRMAQANVSAYKSWRYELQQATH